MHNPSDIIDLKKYRQWKKLRSREFAVEFMVGSLRSAADRVPDLEPLCQQLIESLENEMVVSREVLNELMERYTYQVYEAANEVGGRGSELAENYLFAGTAIRRVVQVFQEPVKMDDDDRVKAAWFQGWIAGFGHGIGL